MLGSRLARRIVLPLLILLAALFGVLAWVAVQIAEDRVEEELRLSADRVAGVGLSAGAAFLLSGGRLRAGARAAS